MKASTKRKLHIRLVLVVGALIIAYVCGGLFSEQLDTLDSRIIDQLFAWRPNVTSVDPVYEQTIAHVDANFYFSRPQHAQVIRNLTTMKVSAQLVDFIFEDMVSKEEDRALIKATEAAGNVYYGLAFKSLSKRFEKDPFLPDSSDTPDPAPPKWQVVVNGDTKSFYMGAELQRTYPALSSAARGIGFLNLTPDPDGILRRLPLLVRYRGDIYPSLSFRMVCDYLGVAPENIIVKPGISIVLKSVPSVEGSLAHDVIIPIDESGSIILNETGLGNTIQHFRSGEVFEASQNSAKLDQLTKALSGKIVVLSETVDKRFKIRSGGNEKLLSSGMIHALVVQNILAGRFLSELSGPTGILIDIGILIVILLMSVRFSSPLLSLGTLSLAGAYISLAVLFFFYVGTIFQFARPLLMMLCAISFLLIGMGIENALLFAKTERARKIAERELEIGREIQSGFFPTVLPKPEGWELSTYFQTARHVAGDFYDVFSLGKEKRVGIVIADVCDKGVGAALFMALFRSFIRVLSGTAHSEGHLELDSLETRPENILLRTIRSINNYISITHAQAGMFATIFYGILEPQTGELSFVNGGHEPPMIIGPNGIKTILKPTGPAVGLYPNMEFKTGSIIMEPRDTLLIYTDGVTDAQNKAGAAFTRNRLINLVENSFATAEDLINKIKTGVNEHISGENQFDDITILALRRRI